jgi:hypothetical protein
MQPWQIKALELETSGLKHLDGCIGDHAILFLFGAIYLLLALLIWVLSGGLRRKFPNRTSVLASAFSFSHTRHHRQSSSTNMTGRMVTRIENKRSRRASGGAGTSELGNGTERR